MDLIDPQALPEFNTTLDSNYARSRFKAKFAVQIDRAVNGDFAITVLALIAVVFSDPRAPVAKFLDRHGDSLLLANLLL